MSLTAINLDSETLAKLDESARFRSLSREEMLKAVINDVADYDLECRMKIEAGEKDYRAGRFVSQQEATALAEERKRKIMEMSNR